ncbi:NAD-dependent histone deacetylase sir2 [Coemansia sp. IMI 209127]|nr:NAD-dependent histone deacetylase sir2 [Coemansia sp. IMI 209127]
MADEDLKQNENGILLARVNPENSLIDSEHGAAIGLDTPGLATGSKNSDSTTSMSKRRKESMACQGECSVSVGVDGNTSKRHRFETMDSVEVAQVNAAGLQVQNIALEEGVVEDRVSDSADAPKEDSNGEESDGDEELNIDGSYAPSPLNTADVDTHQPSHTRFTPEEMEVIRDEARALGLGAFMQHYIVDMQVSVRALLEVFVDSSLVDMPVPDFQLLPLLSHQLIRFLRNRPKLPNINTIDDVVELLQKSKRIMVLTGAGVSVSCGIPDFRSPTGIYTRLNEEFGLDDPQQMFDIEYFREMPELFYSFAKDLYPGNFQPAPTHAFVKLLEDNGQLLRNYTQNIDTLEHVQGIKNVLNCHGSFATATCIKCGYKCDGKELEKDIMAGQIAYCPECTQNRPKREGAVSEKAVESLGLGTAALLGDPSKPIGSSISDHTYNENGEDDDDEDDDDYGAIRGIMKPDITFFGEKLPDKFDQALTEDREKVDLLLVMGSSLKVAPVSDIMGNLPHTVPQIVINKTPILHFNFDVQLLGNADDIVAYLTRRCGWELRHQRIPGDCTSSEEFAQIGPAPIDSPPSIAIPIRVPVDKTDVDDSNVNESNAKASALDIKIVEKTYSVPKHWHPFPSAVITGKDLFVANGDSKVRLAVSSSDEEEDDDDDEEGDVSDDGSRSEVSDSGPGSDGDGGADSINTNANNGEPGFSKESSEELVRDISKASV